MQHYAIWRIWSVMCARLGIRSIEGNQTNKKENFYKRTELCYGEGGIQKGSNMWVGNSFSLFVALQLRWKGGRFQWLAKVSVLISCPVGHQGEDRGGISGVGKVQSILLRLWVGESVMTSLQGAGPRLRLAVESKWSAISSAMKVFRSTSWRPFLRRLRDWAGWVGEPGGPERTEMLAMAPLRPGKENRTKHEKLQE